MDSILSVRINEDLKNKFIKLAEEEGINNKEFMDLIIRSYEINKTSTGIDYIKSDVDELQSITKRMLDIYINIVEKSKVRSTESTNAYKMEIEKSVELINKLEKDKEDLKNKIETLKEELNLSNEKTSKKEEAIIELSDNIKEYKDMNELLKVKIKDFESIKEQYISLEEDRDELKLKYSELKNQNEKYLKDINRYTEQINKLEKQVDASDEINKIKTENLKEELSRRYTLKEDELTLKYKKDIFQLEEKHKEEIWNLKSHYEEKLAKLGEDKELLLDKLSKINLEQ